MKKPILIAIATILLAALVCPTAWSQATGEVYLGGFLLLRVRCAAGGYTIDERVNALQLRANNLLELGKKISDFTVRKSGKDANIYADNELFMTVTPADGAANGTTAEKQARTWTQRLRTLYPDAKTKRPGMSGPD